MSLQKCHHVISWASILFTAFVAVMFLCARRSQMRWCTTWTGEEEKLNIAHLEPEFCYSPIYFNATDIYATPSSPDLDPSSENSQGFNFLDNDFKDYFDRLCKFRTRKP